MSIDPRGGWMQRFAIALCPPGDRRWLRALLAEAGEAQGVGARAIWIAGAGGIVASAIGARVASAVPAWLRFALVTAPAAAVTLRLLAYFDYGALRLDDDIFLAGSLAMAGACCALCALAARAVFGRAGGAID